jgi:hypothetical protein
MTPFSLLTKAANGVDRLRESVSFQQCPVSLGTIHLTGLITPPINPVMRTHGEYALPDVIPSRM